MKLFKRKLLHFSQIYIWSGEKRPAAIWPGHIYSTVGLVTTYTRARLSRRTNDKKVIMTK